MSKLQTDLEAHIKEDNENYKHFSNRLDHFANYLQSAMNPTVKLKNGEDQEVFMSEAVVMIYDDMKYVKVKFNELDQRTKILDDLNQIKINYLQIKNRLKKILKPVIKFIVMICSIFLMLYLLIMVAAGKLSVKDAYEFFIKIVKF